MNEEEVIAAIEKAMPSVVSVGTIRLVRRSLLEVVPLKGVGSGFIMDPDGCILTNSHVVEGSREIEVVLQTGEKLKGVVRGSDPSSDIALIRVAAKDLPQAELGDSDNLKVGQGVIAIGNPLGLAGGPTVTTGVISSLNRHIESENLVLENLIQTDAAINPGNSGGPLMDRHGRVIGVNTAIIPFAQGIGFAIPINKAKYIADELREYGEVRRAGLGIVGINLDERIAYQYGLPLSRGALVIGVRGGSAAERYGIRVGDIITDLEGTPIDSINKLQGEISRRKPGEEVQIRLNSQGRDRILKVILGRA
jgi:S1-C subfamily serine protease